MDGALDGLRRRLAVTNGKYGTWLTADEATALLPILETMHNAPRGADARPKMVRGPELHKAVLSPDEDK